MTTDSFSADAPRRSVLLRHDLPDGSWHFDWLLQYDDAGPDEPVASVRVQVDPFRTPEFEGVILPDHRAMYLDYSGPVSNGRGSVTRIEEVGVVWFSRIRTAGGREVWLMRLSPDDTIVDLVGVHPSEDPGVLRFTRIPDDAR